ncbi:hypothetical protein D0Z00_003631 [Geotrichum galactomycetum]|uniref:Uncharacterized protein n=1 Tax=Geotrichum galactomycetum TaxID=27317 RepID=A0ACB6V0S4_9ASCO|nr:hypothetical protein D0Z00_003631 [Geotrichum candidum]
MVRTSNVSGTFIASKNRLAEGPTYDPRTHRLYWVDITNNQINWIEYDEPENIHRVKTNHSVGVIALTSTPNKLLVGAKLGFGFVDLTTPVEAVEIDYVLKVHTAEPEASELRFNDGYVDAKGRFYAGSMVDLGFEEKPIGKLYCFDFAKNTAEIVETGLMIPNGMGWSPDNKIMYHTDSPRSTIYQYDYDLETGAMTNRRVFVKVNFEGIAVPEPDGLCVSQDGSVWTAIFGTSTVRRYSPQGELLEEIKFPASRVTCPALVGPSLNELVVTSMSLYNERPDYHELAKTEQGECGNIFKTVLDGVVGIPRNLVNID